MDIDPSSQILLLVPHLVGLLSTLIDDELNPEVIRFQLQNPLFSESVSVGRPEDVVRHVFHDVAEYDWMMDSLTYRSARRRRT